MKQIKSLLILIILSVFLPMGVFGAETLSIYMSSTDVKDSGQMKTLTAFERETGIKVVSVVLAGNNKEARQAQNIRLISGDTTDIIKMNVLQRAEYSEGGLLLQLDGFAHKESYDVEKMYGPYLTRTKGGLFSLPWNRGKWAVYYNKKIFDDAGVPYPKAPWTWNDYIATAKKLTNRSKKIYGSFMTGYDVFKYYTAKQKGVKGYKPNGMSNYDNPAFKEALKFFGDLGNTYRVQPSWTEFKARKMNTFYFISTGKFGMTLISDFYTSRMNDWNLYKRDWKWGIVATPGPANLQVTANIGINKNSKNQDAAWKFVKFWAENAYIYQKRAPARIDFSDKIWEEFYKGQAKDSRGSVTTADLQGAFENDAKLEGEKFQGIAASQYSSIINQEAELYLIGSKSLDDAVASIRERMDAAIKQ